MNKNFLKLYKKYENYVKENGKPPYNENFRELHIYSLLVVIESISNDKLQKYKNSQIKLNKNDLFSVGLYCAIKYVDKYIINEKKGINTASLVSYSYKQIKHKINKYCIDMLSIVSFDTDKGFKDYNKFDVIDSEENPIIELKLGEEPQHFKKEMQIFECLQDYEIEIVEKYYGLGGYSTPQKLKEISKNSFLDSREVGYVLKKSIKKMKNYINNNKLEYSNLKL